jgi:hypothetical protein
MNVIQAKCFLAAMLVPHLYCFSTDSRKNNSITIALHCSNAALLVAKVYSKDKHALIKILLPSVNGYRHALFKFSLTKHGVSSI